MMNNETCYEFHETQSDIHFNRSHNADNQPISFGGKFQNSMNISFVLITSDWHVTRADFMKKYDVDTSFDP